MHCMELGGAERSLLGLLYSIDYKKYQVDLLLYRHTGELLKYVPKEVNILEQDNKMSMLGIPMVDVIKKGQISTSKIYSCICKGVHTWKLNVNI